MPWPPLHSRTMAVPLCDEGDRTAEPWCGLVAGKWNGTRNVVKCSLFCVPLMCARRAARAQCGVDVTTTVLLSGRSMLYRGGGV